MSELSAEQLKTAEAAKKSLKADLMVDIVKLFVNRNMVNPDDYREVLGMSDHILGQIYAQKIGETKKNRGFLG